ncbi:hypothetical protein EG856_03595 [Mycoplasmopsis phocirhinis]|uniref:Uncharacterized protein n=1 Tax=Mycoplasmopsis phocirhinis TaxID=142650 RepID=A0A4V0ZAK0_9BACT|nr:hypothetical protein [Mycoplasmopsis phocirhinis]QBF34972.1 hypothetical protein EG856_03595 [Mycoplasmopsis phocirhinis]
MNKSENFKAKLLVPLLQIPFEAKFKSIKESNDIQNIIILFLLYDYDKYCELTVKEFLAKITGVNRTKLINFLLQEFKYLLDNKIILSNNLVGLSILEIGELFLTQLGEDDKIINPIIEKEFDKDNFIGLESVSERRNYLFSKNLLDLTEDIKDIPRDLQQNTKNDDYEYIDTKNFFKTTYHTLLYSTLKNYFNSTNLKNKVFVDYELHKKQKNQPPQIEQVNWVDKEFNFNLFQNEINTNDEETLKFLKKIINLQIESDVEKELKINKLCGKILNTIDINNLKTEFIYDENISQKFLSVLLNNEIINKTWTQNEKELFDIFDKKILIDSKHGQKILTFLISERHSNLLWRFSS